MKQDLDAEQAESTMKETIHKTTALELLKFDPS